MSNMAICEKYLKEKDELLFEIYTTCAVNKISILLNIIGAFLSGGTFDSNDNYYILGIGKSNIYIVSLGKYICYEQIPKDIKPKEVKIVEIKSAKSISISPALFGLLQRITITEQNNTHIYYISKKFINEQQLKCLKEIII